MCAGILGLQAVVLFLTGVVTIGMTDLGAVTSLSLGLGLAVLCVLAAGLLGRAVGYWLGWAVQVLSIALGLLTAPMFFLGVVFTALWATAYFLGGRMDEERAERVVLEEQWQARQSPEPGGGG
jgi:ABC-type dipeptide/oligopeptide/nickel transport system permease subunit